MMMSMRLPFTDWWRNLSVAHKLFALVGVMGILIAFELFTLLFAMNTLSSVRAFVGGEGIWSKAQKEAVLELQNYAWTGDERTYRAFEEHLKIPMGDHRARAEMEKPDMDIAIVTEGFIAGGIHPQDIVPMVQLIRRFHENPFIGRALTVWKAADDLMFKLIEVAKEIRTANALKDPALRRAMVDAHLREVFRINAELRRLEDDFSFTLGEASRWLESFLMILLVAAVATVESTGLFLTFAFSRGLSRVLSELRGFAVEVGAGRFSHTVPVRTRDELGQLAMALNKMASDLREISSEKRVAERANRIKSLFLANMSHEIRTPLNSILGFVELLRDPSLSRAEHQKFIAIIERTGHGLATIINDILDISKVEAGKLEVEKSVCSLKQLVNDLRSTLEIRCEEKGIAFRLHADSLPEYIVTDSTRYKQILMNVIGNAIKFTERGEVFVSFEVRDHELRCIVRDTGVGIAPENLGKLFQTFSQVDSTIRKQFGGSGLGLTLAKRLAQRLGGDVTLQSSIPRQGSVFVVSIAIEIATHQQETWMRKEKLSVQPAKALSGKRVLLVEDSIDNQILARQFLELEGAEVEVASHGQEGIETAIRNIHDVVLMDMQMPVMDGYTATTQLRRLGYRTPILALTANAMKEDLEKCLSAGCDAYISKPYRRANLVSTILEHCRQTA